MEHKWEGQVPKVRIENKDNVLEHELGYREHPPLPSNNRSAWPRIQHLHRKDSGITLLPLLQPISAALKISNKHQDKGAIPSLEKFERGEYERRNIPKDPASNNQVNDHQEVKSSELHIKKRFSSRATQDGSDHAGEVIKEEEEEDDVQDLQKNPKMTMTGERGAQENRHLDNYPKVIHQAVLQNIVDKIGNKVDNPMESATNRRAVNNTKGAADGQRKQIFISNDLQHYYQTASKNQIQTKQELNYKIPLKDPAIITKGKDHMHKEKLNHRKFDGVKVDIMLGGRGTNRDLQHPKNDPLQSAQNVQVKDVPKGHKPQQYQPKEKPFEQNAQEWQPRHEIMPQPGDKWKRVHELYQDLLQHKQAASNWDDRHPPLNHQHPNLIVQQMNRNQAWWQDHQRKKQPAGKYNQNRTLLGHHRVNQQPAVQLQGKLTIKEQSPGKESQGQKLPPQPLQQENLAEHLRFQVEQIKKLQQEQRRIQDHLHLQNHHQAQHNGLDQPLINTEGQLQQQADKQAGPVSNSKPHQNLVALGNKSSKDLQQNVSPDDKSFPEGTSLPNKKTADHMIAIRMNLIQHIHKSDDFSPRHRKICYRDKNVWPEMFAQWLSSAETYCDEKFVAYNGEFAHIKELIIDRNFCHGRKGGEAMQDVFNQPEDEEYYTYYPGFFQMTCSEKPLYNFNNNNHLNQWLYSLNHKADNSLLYNEMRPQFTIALVRYEYANLYHTMTDYYNAFALMELFNKSQIETNILLIDGHPAGALDPVWNVLFNSSTRISALNTRTKFTNIVWSILGYNSPMMDHYAPTLPLVEDFRNFFLSSFRIADSHKLNCDRINIMFIWRRDYIAHPRNPSGMISRKIQNEQELVDTLRKDFPAYTVKGVQIDLFEMRQQLEFARETDLLIGMHGAGLTHTMFLPKHAGLIELLPTYWSAANEHFHAIAKWRKIRYRQWTNQDPENEAPNHFTKIPPEVLKDLVTTLVNIICGYATDTPYDMTR